MSRVVILKKHEDRRISRGHLWAFSNEIEKIDGAPEAGEIVELRSHAGNVLGVGFYNPHSLIAVRLLSRDREEIDFQFFRRRIESALALRKRLYPDADAFRLVHGESDFLPGLVIDVYGKYVSIQAVSFGMDRRLTLICDVLDAVLHPKGIVERNESALRTLEHLPLRKGVLRGDSHAALVEEHGIVYSVDVLEGQKTGFFLDQRENRLAIRRYVRGGRVLDCFCNDGGFALNAVAGGANEVVGVDVSETAIRHAVENASRNEMAGKVRFITADVFDFLREAESRQERFDVINLDPPSFAKNKKGVSQAKRGYRELHEAALKLLTPGGFLATASCSHHIEDETFLEIVAASARAVGRTPSLLEWKGASADHPVLPEMPETHYLKFLVFRMA